MSGITVAIRYAKALYEVAREKDMIVLIREDIAKINEIMIEISSIRDYCLKLHSTRMIEMNFVSTAFVPYVSQLTGEMLKIIVRNGRLSAVPYLYLSFKKIMDMESKTTEVVLESTWETEKILEKTIETKMETRLGHKIKINTMVVPKLLGGIRILWDDRMIDLSAAGRLKKMKALLKAV